LDGEPAADRPALPLEVVKLIVLLLLGLAGPIFVAIVGTAVLFVAGTVVQGNVLERRLGVETQS
jgi:hypothetical protein